MKNKLDIIHEYNHNNGDVYGLDQMVSYYLYERRATKWWKNIFFYLFEVGIYNCYIYYKLINAYGDNYYMFEFREALFEQFIQ